MPHRSLRLLAGLPLVVALAAAAPMTARAQDAMDAKTAGFLRDRYVADMDSVHAKIMALAAAIPEDKYSWRPAAGVRSVSEVLMHLASEWMFYMPMSVGAKPPADFGPPRETLPRLEKITGKTEVVAQLDKGWAYGRQQLTSADPATLTGQYAPWKVTLPEAAFGMTGDQHEHLGQLIAYARSVGVKPPWSK
jgi:uncharacterized damage-inducible protein DinB